ncbi:phenylacetic acid degradation bifunctional protein PaaZ [Deinococcus radiodurans]|jgi:phenylacetic acid degradation protein paaN|uniref:Aldehyde dehydrogenase n=1 Tax=Deinococcus radiodurans (strain ATCC 13939 / DSM 20539 / JCM 16871 / CCUG 27074 / LMG 4051 / NBRC 15346 / NCIMB 9279 / VKM B-1422 / R1) TaxID=243230 RepID=Q9RRV4_DEIRA|nr:phenylacetic acid degradation bifunctional protein PaaZ [Deinococcus radiodurans]AAF11927.1 aldehyde dehydrogenase [Deinococcus radiodurans R1 = ATCC 13939 = DSM 20539]ANC70571.1 phenylacetic acid degradation bifunctional protein PaaZ [Deinococcus radiodurans R1 = ATCC 13939 = DSM 20539]QEM71758.1 phenylacetic acid degradation bifunctional protein PaaZ [Deinococcus radiodurans]UDL01400.1 phenylacetic acid degradation bifunctional protein PaaZ [Deinococcus radiodurans R1 = ATCC 13939 = DSM 20
MTTPSTQILRPASYVYGQWHANKDGQTLLDAVYGRPVAVISSEGVDFAQALAYGREAGAGLRKLTFHTRARMLKALGNYLMERKEDYYALNLLTGATRRDGWVDIEGGIGTLFSYSSMARRELPDERFLPDGKVEVLGKGGTFMARHLLVPREGVAVQINAYNFPVWGMLEKLAPAFIAGMPSLVKPAPQTAYLTERVVRDIIASGILPEGSLQLVTGDPGDLLDHLLEQDMVAFTGSAATANKLKVHPNIVARSIPFNAEADSLNAAVLGVTVRPKDPEFALFVKEVAREMTGKAGQKCTAIRRPLVPCHLVDPVVEALRAELAKVTVGDPARDDVRMGALVSVEQRERVRETLEKLGQDAEVVIGGGAGELLGGDREKGAFLDPTVLLCRNPLEAKGPHELEAFGPVATLMPYDTLDDAITLAKMGRGSLAASVVTFNRHEATELVLGIASTHGRVLVLNRADAKESTGHGSPLPQLLHGGPGRAGGGAEMAGLAGVKHHMNKVAVQADPTTLAAITKEHIPGAEVREDVVHPFRKTFDQIQPGDSLLTHRRTVTEADIVNFAALTGDHFYAHVDDIGAKEGIFGKRVAHGYFLISAAAGQFVSAAPGPVLANYGLENLRFVEPVGIGDTIRTRLTCKRKIRKDLRPGEERPTGVVEWHAEITNQHEQLVATYDILTLVERARDEFDEPAEAVEGAQA